MNDFDSSIFNNGLFGIDVSRKAEGEAEIISEKKIESEKTVLADRTQTFSSPSVYRQAARGNEKTADFVFDKEPDFDLSR